MPSIRELLANGTEFDLCNGVFERIVEVHGEDLDASTLAKEHRTVLLILHSMGIIGNGGFNYLFEGSFTGDPYFALTAEAFREIGCKAAAEAFQRALDLFPNSQPPTDIDRRLTIYRQGAGAIRRLIDEQFWNATGEIDRCLTLYIRAHRAQFESLDSAPRKDRIFAKPASMPLPREWELEVARLPRWACVGLAARCARHLIPIFDANWPNAPQHRRDAVIAAIVAAEKSAAEARTADDVGDAELNSTITAGAALGGLYGVRDGMDSNVPSDGNKASTASFVAKAAAKAAETAKAEPDKLALVAIEAFSFALNAAEGSPKIHEKMHRDLDRLRAVATRAKWTDVTAVPSSIFEE